MAGAILLACVLFLVMAACGGGGGGSSAPPAPTVSSFTPASNGVGTVVTITGTSFTGATAVSFNGMAAAKFSVVSATSITAMVPAGATTGRISVTTPNGTCTASTVFTVIPAPVIASFAPALGGVGTSVILTGTGFTGATAVMFNGTTATTFSVGSDTSMTAAVPAGAATGTISVATAGGTAASTASFAVTPGPGITSFTPAAAGLGAAVTITGAGFTGATAVTFNGLAATFSVVNDTSITTTVPAGASTGTISVTAPNGTGISSWVFTFVPAPTVASFLPAAGGAGTSVTITGVNLTGATAVLFNATSATTFSVASATSINATVPAGASTGPISVTTLGGTATSSSAFTFVPAPTVSSFLPAIAKIGDSVTITGTHLTGATAVTFNGTAAVTFSVASDTSISATVPAGAASGAIGVTTPGGTGASSAALTVIPFPAISGFSPASGGAGVLVTLTGTHFTGATAVAFNGAAAASFTVASDTSILATVPGSATVGGITVTTPGGTATSGRFLVGSLALYAGVPSGIGNANGPAAAARFFGPYGAAVDAAGNIYVADRSNNVIRKITTAGAVTTLAGTADLAGHSDGPGAAALFNDPASVAVGPITGNLYVADRANSNIRMITPAGIVTTFSGTGTSGDLDGSSTALPAPSFFHPTGIAVDASENVYVADSGNNSIRKIVPAAPGTPPVTVSTLTPVPSGLSNPCSVAVAGLAVYVADTANHAIKTVPTSGGAATSLASGFINPLGLTVDTSVPVNVYVTDAGSNLISVVNSSTGTVTPFAGWGDHSGSTEGFGATPASNPLIGTAPEFDFPTGIALGTTGNPTSGSAFVADYNNNAIRRVPITGGTPPTSTVSTSTYAGKAGAPGLADGTLIGSALFNAPAGVAVDAAGHIYVADSNNNAIRELFPAPSTAGATTPALTGPSFSAPTGVAVDTFTGSGNIYVADSGNNAIRVISGTTVTTLSAGTTFSSPFGVAVDSAGNVYVADTFNNMVKKVTIAAPTSYPVTGTTTSLPGSYNHPFGVALDPVSGKVYVADTYNNAIEVVSGGVFSVLAGSAAGVPGFADGAGTLALFNHPNGLAVDPATGNIYVSDTYNQAVRMVTASGTVVTLAGVGTLGSIIPGALPGQLAFPYGIAVDPSLTLDGSGHSNPDGSLIISTNDALLTLPY